MAPTAHDIGPAIREVCKKRGISLSKLARDAGISWNPFHKVVSGKAIPTLDTLDKIVRALGDDSIIDEIVDRLNAS